MTSWEIFACCALIALSVPGWLNALYFSLVARHLLKPDSRLIPQICRMDEVTCATVVHTPQARALGIPNSDLGLLYYLWIAAFGLSWLVTGEVYLGGLTLLASLFTVCLGTYLVYSLMRVLRTHCPMCYMGHTINGLMFLLILSLTF